MNTRDYQNVFNNHFSPISENVEGPCFMFQQVKARIPSSYSMSECFISDGVYIINWLALNIHLRQIENLLEILTRAAYASTELINSTSDLKQAILFQGRIRTCSGA